MDDSAAERIARLHLALAGGESARFADLREIEAAARIEARWPGTGAQFSGAFAFHASIARWAAARDGAAGILFGASGPPGAAAPHAAAMEAVPGTRVVYADVSGEAAFLNGRLLAGPGVSAVQASVRDPERLMGLPEVRDLGSPLQLHLQLCLHYWPEDMCRELIGWYAEHLRKRAPGSTLALSLWSPDGTRAGEEFLGALEGAAGYPVQGHSRGAVAGWLEDAGTVLLGPGIAGVGPRGRGWAWQAAVAPRSPGRVLWVVARVR